MNLEHGIANDAMIRAKQRGLDPAAELDRMGMLMTMRKREQIQRETAAEAWNKAADMIEEMSIRQMLGKQPATFTDYKAGIVTWLRTAAKEL